MITYPPLPIPKRVHPPPLPFIIAASLPTNPLIKCVSHYLLGPKLGEGAFGLVRSGEHEQTHQKVAIKILDKEKLMVQELGESIRKEVTILQMIEHVNVVKLVEVLAS